MNYKITEKKHDELTLVDNIQLHNFVEKLKEYYPDIVWWFWNKVITDENSINLFIEKNQEIVGFMLLKNSKTEKKIRTFFISPEVRNKNLPKKMFNIAEIILNTKPAFSFPEELKDFYIKFSDIMGYSIDEIHKDVYRKGKQEYFVNYKISFFENSGF